MNHGSDQQDVLRNMIMTFRVSELQMLLGFAGRNKNGKKHELQARALELVKIRSTPMQAKIRELYKASQQSQALMNPQGGHHHGYPPGLYQNPAALNLMGGHSAYAGASAAAAALQGRNPYSTGAAGGYAAAASSYYQQQQQALAAARSVPMNPDVKYVKLPFFDVHAELLKPMSLVAQGSNRFQEAQFQFFLTPQQATDIASNRDVSVGCNDYLYQIQLRFCQLTNLDGSKELPDEFPPSVCVQVNGKMAPLPNPIPTNKPGVEPKRPPRPVNITPMCKLSPILPNNINVKWAAEYGKSWVVGIWLVMKMTSSDLLERLKKKGTRNPEFTRGLIVEKLNDDDEVATTSLKVSVSCPLGKMRMQVPCRPSTCSHLQCFDASLFLQMNERKPTWNCPVCDSKALYDMLLIDGYFQEVLQSKDLPKDENEILLEQDGSWKPVPKEDEKTRPPSSMPPAQKAGGPAAASGEAKKDDEVEYIDLSDDDEPVGAPPLPPDNNAQPPLPPLPMAGGLMPPLPPLPPAGAAPPMPPMEIECIDLE